jgi:hypothetical protein
MVGVIVRVFVGVLVGVLVDVNVGDGVLVGVDVGVTNRFDTELKLHDGNSTAITIKRNIDRDLFVLILSSTWA